MVSRSHMSSKIRRKLILPSNLREKKNVPGNRKEGLSCKANTCQERETKKIHNITSLNSKGWEGTKMNGLETWKRKPARAWLSQKWQRALQEWLSVIICIGFVWWWAKTGNVTNVWSPLLLYLELQRENWTQFCYKNRRSITWARKRNPFIFLAKLVLLCPTKHPSLLTV